MWNSPNSLITTLPIVQVRKKISSFYFDRPCKQAEVIQRLYWFKWGHQMIQHQPIGHMRTPAVGATALRCLDYLCSLYSPFEGTGMCNSTLKSKTPKPPKCLSDRL